MCIRDSPADRLSGAEAAWLLVDVASHGGNLLLNVGPRADGSLDPYQARVIAELGEWMRTYGRYIYASTPGPAPFSLLTPGATAYFVREGEAAGSAGAADLARAFWLAPDGSRIPASCPAPTSSFPVALIVER